MNLAEVRSRLSFQRGEALWRSLEELCDAPEFRKSVEREFPGGVPEWERDGFGGPSRRRFLQLMGASLMLAGVGGVSGCSDKPEDARIVPYVDAPEAVVPGKPMFFATAMPMDGYGVGVLVSSREGRPIKVEGNPDHPASLGGTDPIVQASILGLYDPDRSKVVTRGGQVSTWGAFYDAVRGRLERKRASGGEGVCVFSGTVTSPTLAAQLQELGRQFPKMRRFWWEPVGRANTQAGAVESFGKPVAFHYDLSHAKVIVSLGSDFLMGEAGSIRYARQFADGRRVRRDQTEMNRLYVVEGPITITGSMADHRLVVRPSKVAALARAKAAAFGVSGVNGETPAGREKWVQAVADDLRANRGAGLVVVGESQPPEVHALGHAINHALGNVGSTVVYTDPIDPFAAERESASLEALVSAMRAGRVDTLLILGGNPVYTAPADVPFASELTRLSKQRGEDGTYTNLIAHLGVYDDETAFRCQWHVPETHHLEVWGDVRGFDGTVSILQPLIAPLFGGRSASEVLETLLGRPDRSGYEVVRGHWSSQHAGNDFEQWWERTLKAGVVAGTALPPLDVPTPQVRQRQGGHAATSEPGSTGDGLEVVFRPDYCVWDGSFANNSWLQELPKPFTKLTWDNAAMVGPRTAEKLSLADQDVVTLSLRGRSVDAPVLVVPGVPEGVVCVSLGYGRTRAGHVGTVHGPQTEAVGFDAYQIRPAVDRWFAAGLTLSKTGKVHHLVTTRSHHAMATLEDFHRVIDNDSLKPNAIVTTRTPEEARETSNRKLVRVATLEEFKRNPEVVKDLGGEKEKKPLLSLYPGPKHGGWDYSKGYQWGMSIDMSTCIGCNACVVACQAENNIPVVGKTEVARQREMHWIRIDDYYGGSIDDPKVYHQPVPCMQCENAPCEYVCPVGATTHSAEGINQMTYNRCVGTRYCSNNCPYKVRRFNFLSYADAETNEGRKLQRNPDVTVRTNGVMEKCNYCIQRLQLTRIEAEKTIVELSERARNAATEEERNRLEDESRRREYDLLERLQTACQQACPTRAIEFGSIHEVAGQKTRVAKLKEEPLDYSLLRELTTVPRTTYMARIQNPNPRLEGDAEGGTA